MSDNPYESPEAREANQAQARTRSTLRTFGRVAMLVAVGALLVALLLPARRKAGGAARRNGCLNNMRQIVLALLNYESEHGTLPPAYTVDAEGNRLHSWRTLILPYLEERRLYETIDLSKPWDHPVNAKAQEALISAYYCPGAFHEDELTTYLAVVGPECVFTGPVPRGLNEIHDGARYTMVLVDVDSDRAVHWMSPDDADEDLVLGLDPDSSMNHSGVFIAAFLDGHTSAISLDSSQEMRRALMTVAGGDQAANDSESQ